MSRTLLHEEWRKRMKSFARSGLSRREWCDREGIGLPRFGYWRRRLSAPAVELESSSSEAWCAVEVIGDVVCVGDDSGLGVRVGGAVIDVRCGFDPATLRAVVAALDGRAC